MWRESKAKSIKKKLKNSVVKCRHKIISTIIREATKRTSRQQQTSRKPAKQKCSGFYDALGQRTFSIRWTTIAAHLKVQEAVKQRWVSKSNWNKIEKNFSFPKKAVTFKLWKISVYKRNDLKLDILLLNLYQEDKM